MLHFIYETKNLLNGKIYRGRHSTVDLDDGYLGSGNVILSAIKQHGRRNFIRTILEYLPSQEALEDREQELVNEEFVARDDTYNLITGGRGSAPKDEDQCGRISKGVKLRWQDEAYQASQRTASKSQKVSNAQLLSWASGTRKKMERVGSSSSGKTWMTFNGKSTMVPRDLIAQYEQLGYHRGRIIKG